MKRWISKEAVADLKFFAAVVAGIAGGWLSTLIFFGIIRVVLVLVTK